MTGTFAMVPTEVLATGNGFAIAVYAAIAQYAGKEGTARPSIARLMEATGWSRPTIDKAIRALCDAGVLVKENRSKGGLKQSNAYTLPLDNRARSSKPENLKPANVQIEATLPTMVTSDASVRNDVTDSTQPGFHELEPVNQNQEPEPPVVPLVQGDRFRTVAWFFHSSRGNCSGKPYRNRSVSCPGSLFL